MDISNHPISQFIINNGTSGDITYNNIEFVIGFNRPSPDILSYLINPRANMYFDVNFANEIIRRLNKKRNRTIGLFTNAFPIYYKFSEYGRNYIKSQLMPNQIMRNYIDSAFHTLRLQPNTYAVIHIRTGDEYLTATHAKLPPFTDKILNIINKMKNPAKKYLILSDNDALKSLLKKIPNFYVYMHKIEHLGGDINHHKRPEGIKNSLLEFYLMSYSNSILALSVYGHISGFSRYCSEVYNIPFTNMHIESQSSKIIKLNLKL